HVSPSSRHVALPILISAINSSHSSVHAPNRGYSTPGGRTSRMVTTAERAAAVRARTQGMAAVSSHGAKALGGGTERAGPGSGRLPGSWRTGVPTGAYHNSLPEFRSGCAVFSVLVGGKCGERQTLSGEHWVRTRKCLLVSPWPCPWVAKR